MVRYYSQTGKMSRAKAASQAYLAALIRLPGTISHYYNTWGFAVLID